MGLRIKAKDVEFMLEGKKGHVRRQDIGTPAGRAGGSKKTEKKAIPAEKNPGNRLTDTET